MSSSAGEQVGARRSSPKACSLSSTPRRPGRGSRSRTSSSAWAVSLAALQRLLGSRDPSRRSPRRSPPLPPPAVRQASSIQTACRTSPTPYSSARRWSRWINRSVGAAASIHGSRIAFAAVHGHSGPANCCASRSSSRACTRAARDGTLRHQAHVTSKTFLPRSRERVRAARRIGRGTCRRLGVQPQHSRARCRACAVCNVAALALRNSLADLARGASATFAREGPRTICRSRRATGHADLARQALPPWRPGGGRLRVAGGWPERVPRDLPPRPY